jgi:hypothetical protein
MNVAAAIAMLKKRPFLTRDAGQIICALRNDPTFDLAQSSGTEIFLVLVSGKCCGAGRRR